MQDSDGEKSDDNLVVDVSNEVHKMFLVVFLVTFLFVCLFPCFFVPYSSGDWMVMFSILSVDLGYE